MPRGACKVFGTSFILSQQKPEPFLRGGVRRSGLTWDRTSTLLYQQHKLWPELTQVLLAHGRVSEDTAVLAGLKACPGQNAIILPFRTGAPSKVIAQFLDSLDLGHDFVAGATSRSEGFRLAPTTVSGGNLAENARVRVQAQ